ncbi:T-complex protein 11 [Artemisia annua]|uniref:T-complex protein 11 n=1 Tax=Artemisia annua TaxID=35608 RepID=A0A2U1MI89_ARTAN|nr:T-complex protein 11 [Artemisia annua]
MEIPAVEGSELSSPPSILPWLRRRLTGTKSSFSTVEEIEAKLGIRFSGQVEELVAKTGVVIWFGGKSSEEALNGEMGWCVGGGDKFEGRYGGGERWHKTTLVLGCRGGEEEEQWKG